MSQNSTITLTLTLTLTLILTNTQKWRERLAICLKIMSISSFWLAICIKMWSISSLKILTLPPIFKIGQLSAQSDLQMIWHFEVGRKIAVSKSNRFAPLFSRSFPMLLQYDVDISRRFVESTTRCYIGIPVWFVMLNQSYTSSDNRKINGRTNERISINRMTWENQ